MSPNILIIGGGPVGLATATTLRFHFPVANITVHESRWHLSENKVQWRGPKQGVNRREQVVTLQSSVWSRLPSIIQSAIFPPAGFTSVWPVGPESPADIGFPRNVRIMDIEDRLLELARQMSIRLVPTRLRPAEIDLQSFDLVVAADGPRSNTRAYFEKSFGAADPAPYSLNDTQVEDVVLGLRVQSRLPDPDSVVLTVAQNRFLMNANHGDGYLYMRLTKHEADEVRGRTKHGKRFVSCVQSSPCMMRFSGKDFSCDTHNTTFVPAQDPYSLLWPRVQEGLRLFDAKLLAVTVFRLKMERRPSFVAELTETGVAKPVFGALVGDAANSIHFWPGRGLNHGLYSAIALSRCLRNRWGKSRILRSADFTQFEAAMSALQHRHKDRAWRAMVMRRGDVLQPVSSVISSAIEEADEKQNDTELAEAFMTRVENIANRLENRMPSRPDVDRIRDRVTKYAGSETLNVFVEADGWETRLSGGPEVDLDALVPDVGFIHQCNQKSRTAEPCDSASESAVSLESNESIIERSVLCDESVRTSFEHALKYAGSATLAWNEARRELRALLIRADLGEDLKDDDILDAIEEVDSESPDRIDCDEFAAAMAVIVRKLRSGVDELPGVWWERFQNAVGASGRIETRQAARIVCSVAGNLGAVRGDLVSDKAKVKQIFEERGRNGVDLNLFLEVASMVMFNK